MRLTWWWLVLATSLLILTKSILWVIAVPILQSPDADRHLATIMWYAEKDDKSIKRERKPFSQNMYDITTYHISDEYMQFLKDIDFEQTRFNINSHQTLNNTSTLGPNEENILNYNLDKNIHYLRPTVVNYPPLYYTINSYIYKMFFSKNILTRIYAIRFVSVLISFAIIFLAYKSAKLLKFSKNESLLFAVILAFQPMFSFMSISINLDILLYLAFSMFTYFSIRLLVLPLVKSKKSILNFIFNLFGIFISVLMGIYTKPPGKALIVFSGVVAVFLIYKLLKPFIEKQTSKLSTKTISKIKKTALLTLLILFLVPIVIRLTPLGNFLNSHISFLGNKEFILDDQIMQFIKAETQIENLYLIISTYWGNFGWNDTPMHFIFFIIIVSTVIILLLNFIYNLFFSKNLKNKYIFAYLLTITALFYIAIFGFDFQYFLSKNRLYGIQGRYLTPVILPYFLVLYKSLQFFIKIIDFKIKAFIVAYFMILLNLIALFVYIIPRYYL